MALEPNELRANRWDIGTRQRGQAFTKHVSIEHAVDPLRYAVEHDVIEVGGQHAEAVAHAHNRCKVAATRTGRDRSTRPYEESGNFFQPLFGTGVREIVGKPYDLEKIVATARQALAR
ncbi:MAG: hypothetical protein HYU51_07195 [Candidatus Rokubacteria bacterium]|nr:hypothetical protein [Candidatus Rokubacteria bacterium]